jgi:hypothetical protein
LPNSVKQDNSIETIKYFVEERLIAPFSASVMRSIFLPEKQLHHQLLQVHYHEKNFYQDGVLKFLNRLAEQETITKMVSTAPSAFIDPYLPLADDLSGKHKAKHIMSLCNLPSKISLLKPVWLMWMQQRVKPKTRLVPALLPPPGT